MKEICKGKRPQHSKVSNEIIGEFYNGVSLVLNTFYIATESVHLIHPQALDVEVYNEMNNLKENSHKTRWIWKAYKPADNN